MKIKQTVFLISLIITGCTSEKDLIPGANPTPSPNPIYSIERAGVYTDTEWTAPHGGPRNDDLIDIGPLPKQYVFKFAGAEGATTLYGPSIGPDGTLYFTNGSDHETPNVYAYGQDGKLRWASEPWHTNGKADFDKVDACALWNSPIIDEDGHVYIADCNQLWSFTNEGNLRWVTKYPMSEEALAQDRPLSVAGTSINSFGGIFFSIDHDQSHHADGFVGGVTFWGDIVVMDRHTGELVSPVVNLPGVPTNVEFSSSLFMASGFSARGVDDAVWNFFQGLVESSNAPAVHPTNDRIYVTGWDDSLSDPSNPNSEAKGALYGFKLKPRPINTEGFSHDIVFDYKFVQGPRSGSSPTISPDGKTVYVTEGGQLKPDGSLSPSIARSLTAEAPARQKWQNAGDLQPSSFAIDAESNAISFSMNAIVAFPPEDPTPNNDMTIEDALWIFDTQEIAKQLLPPMPENWLTRQPGVNLTWLLPSRVKTMLTLREGEQARFIIDRLASSPNCVVSIQRDTVTGCTVVGYSAALIVYDSASQAPVSPSRELRIPIMATEAAVFSLNRKNGELIDIIYRYNESSEGVSFPTANGLLATTRGGLISGLSEMLGPLMFVAGLEPAMKVRGGIEVAEGLDDLLIDNVVGGAIENGYIRVYTDAKPGEVVADGKAIVPGLAPDKIIAVNIRMNTENTGMEGTISILNTLDHSAEVYQIVSAHYSGYKGISGEVVDANQVSRQFSLNDWSNAQL